MLVPAAPGSSTTRLTVALIRTGHSNLTHNSRHWEILAPTVAYSVALAAIVCRLQNAAAAGNDPAAVATGAHMALSHQCASQ